jgi:PGF-pre-PGF domain-containing protein
VSVINTNVTFDSVAPGINITFPTINNTNTTNTQLNVNYTVSDATAGVASCWYTNTSGLTNYTLTNCANITTMTWLQGANNITIYVNDSAGNINASSIKFTLDTINPGINITFPTINNTNTTNTQLNVNYTVSDATSGVASCWYTNTSGLVNYTLAGCANITGRVWLQGVNNITIYVNDSANNINASSIRFSLDTMPPVINFMSQTPIDIDTLNLYPSGLNLTYNFTDATTSVNASTVTLFRRTNTSASDIFSYVNGTPVSGFRSTSGTNNQINWTFNSDDNDVYPSKFNVNQSIMENTFHTSISLGNNSVLKIQFLNVSNTTQYNIFEFMANSSAATGALFTFYCNSSYTNGSILTSPNCIQFGSIAGTPTFNASNSQLNSSKYQVIGLNINTTSGKALNSVQVTSTSYFLLRGPVSGGSWNVYNISITPLVNGTQNSSSNGLAWASQNINVDAHLHQYSGADTLYYYACGNDSLGNGNCTTISSDLLQSGGIPPSAPHVYFPVAGNYTGVINISYFPAISPNGLNISFYNLSLLNPNESFNKTIITNNSRFLNYSWNTASTQEGAYIVRVVATDNNSQTSFDLSEIFVVDDDPPTATFSCSPGIVYIGDTVTCTCSVTDVSGVNNSATNYSATPSTGSAGTYTTNCSFADMLGNFGSTTTSYNVLIPPAATQNNPPTNSEPQGTTTTPPETKIEIAKSITEITSQVPLIITDFPAGTGVSQIQIEVTNTVHNVKINITSSTSKPTGVPISKDKSYEYLHIETKNLGENLSKAILTVKVNKSWISANDLNKEDVSLFRFNETSSSWKQLLTTFKQEDNTYDYYNTELKSFSYFSIAPTERAITKTFWTWMIISTIVLIVIIAGILLIKKKPLNKSFKKRKRF